MSAHHWLVEGAGNLLAGGVVLLRPLHQCADDVLLGVLAAEEVPLCFIGHLVVEDRCREPHGPVNTRFRR